MPVENFSDHLSLHFSFNLSDSLSLPSVPTFNSDNRYRHSSSCNSTSSVSWFKVNPDHVSHYCNHLSSIIPEFPSDIFSCCNPDCTAHHQGP